MLAAAPWVEGGTPSPRACIRGSTSRTVTCKCASAAIRAQQRLQPSRRTKLLPRQHPYDMMQQSHRRAYGADLTQCWIRSRASSKVEQCRAAVHTFFTDAGIPPAPGADIGSLARNMSSSSIARTPPASDRGFFAAATGAAASAGLHCSASRTHHLPAPLGSRVQLRSGLLELPRPCARLPSEAAPPPAGMV